MGKSLKGKELGRGITQRSDGRYCARAVVNGIKITLYDTKLSQLRKDFEKEKARLNKEKEKLTKELARSKGMLSNEKFLNNAKPEKVQEEKDKLAKYEQMI